MRTEDMALRETALDDYSDFGEEFERLRAMEIADAVVARPGAAGEISLIDAIEAAWKRSSGESAQPEYTPDQIGQLPGYSRASAIRSAEALAMSSVGRQPVADRINSRLIGPLLHHIALWSDNQYGRCTIGAQRHADYMGCSERQCRSLIIQMVNDGIIEIKVRPGLPPALWLRYPHAIIAASPMQISEAIAPPRRSPGRPSATSKPRKSSLPEDSQTSDGKPRNSYVPGDNTDDQKTPEVKDENPGSLIDKPRNYSASDCKISCKTSKQDSEVKRGADFRPPAPDENVLSHSAGREAQIETVALAPIETPKSERQRGCRLPDGWDPGEAGVNFATEYGLSADEIERELLKFFNHWMGVPGAKGRKSDWPATWRNWVIKAIEYRDERRSRGARHSDRIETTRRNVFGGSQ